MIKTRPSEGSWAGGVWGGGGGGGKRRGLGLRNDVLTTCKAITLRDGQRIIAAFLFPTVNIFRPGALFRSKKRTQKCLEN